ncbi:MAG: acetyl-CoA carboxylase biotin carboxyl carrier protein subunit, partial [Campylobacter sp.]|nr:acetyl-CoA carboxylase biotin carboxyl carrier protein subunit [Campylobacter sp.]
EAMKMEINIESPRDGVIAEILVKQGETVDSGQVLARLQ